MAGAVRCGNLVLHLTSIFARAVLTLRVPTLGGTMRNLFLLASLLAFPGLAFGAQQCVVPDMPLRNVAEIAPTTPSVSSPASSAIPASEPPLPKFDPGKLPVLKHVSDTGAALFDLGISHGMQTVVARHDSQFMVLEVSPDGQAIVAGLQSDLSVAQLQALAGAETKELPVMHGLRGFFVRNGSQFQVLYATPDGERLIPGVMWDVAGENLTRNQVAPIAGMIPTVEIGKDAAAAPVSMLGAVGSTTFGTIGAPTAPRLWVFIDPQCSYSVRAMQQLQPLVAAGRVQLAVIPLSLLDAEDQGLSTKSALAMLSKPAGEMVTAWSRGELTNAPDGQAAAKLKTNLAAAEAIQLKGTPTFVWRKPDGSEGRVDGIPADLNALLASIGG